MSEPKHTPGEWRAVFFEAHDYWDIDCVRGDGDPDDGRDRFSVTEDMTEADARLIAAAPDLLEAAEAFLEDAEYSPDSGAYRALRAAVRKAKGQ